MGQHRADRIGKDKLQTILLLGREGIVALAAYVFLALPQQRCRPARQRVSKTAT
jgi:hypothetical protein